MSPWSNSCARSRAKGDRMKQNPLRELSEEIKKKVNAHKERVEDQQLLADLLSNDSVLPEQAYAMLLVDISMIDQEFHVRERDFVFDLFSRTFGFSEQEIAELVGHAELNIENLRSSIGFAEFLKETLTPEDRDALLTALQGLVHADGVEEDLEVYLKNKFTSLLK